MITVVLVHGFGCNASSWAPVARELGLRGHRTVAVDLPGHGSGIRLPRSYLGTQDPQALATEPSAMAEVGTDDDVAAVTAALRRAKQHGPVILVGHSRGGLTLTAVANTAPDLVDHLVYVSAWCCVELPADKYQAEPEYADSRLGPIGAAIALADPAVVGAIRLNWRTGDPAHLDVLQDALLHDGTRDELLAYLHAQEPDETLHVDEQLTRVDPEAWGRVPHTYVRLTEDRVMPLAMQDRLIAEADAVTPGNPFATASLPTSHLGAQVHADPTADLLEGVIHGLG